LIFGHEKHAIECEYPSSLDLKLLEKTITPKVTIKTALKLL
jgi:hypothetical protein